jgi:Mechanosensitive ion channel, conserved TM helix
MDSPLQKALYGVTEKLIAYLPNLVAGIVLIAIGWFLGWLAKRVVVQILAILRFDRLLRRFKWGAGFAKADVRYAFFEFIGNGAFLIIFMILLNTSFEALQLTVLSDVLRQGVLFVPKLLIAAVIFGFGWLLAGWIAGAIQRALIKEDVPRATLIGRFAKAVIMLFFSSMALTELDIAREIVVIGFSVTIITLGILAIVMTTIGGKTFVSKMLKSLEE